MPTLFDAARIEGKVEEIVRHLRAEPHIVCVQGTTGAGRATIEGILAERWKGAVCVHAPALSEPDAVVHTLMQTAANAGALDEALTDTRSLHDRACAVGKQLADRLLILRLPDSWEEIGEAEGPDKEIFRVRARQLLMGLRDASSLRIVLFATSADRTPWKRFGISMPVVELPQPRVKPSGVGDPSSWGTFADAAARVAHAIRGHEQETSPIHLRLLVGLVGLGVSPEETLRRSYGQLIGPAALNRLLDQMKVQLQRDDALRPVREGLIRCSRARFALALDIARELAAIPDPYEPLLTACVGYVADGRLRIPQPVRRALRSLARGPDADTELRLAGHYGGHDGVEDPKQTKPTTVVAWLEKVHHLAQSGALGHADWARQQLPTREFYWDRARALSIWWNDYRGAAEIYRHCTERFDEDDYAWHYYAWNLDRAGILAEEAEKGFRKAVDISRANRWWNSRLVTFLISQARFQDAEREWEFALERVDPDQVLVQEDQRLARDFHLWVVKEWLEQGEVNRARRVFDQIPPEVVDDVPQLRELRWQLLDAEEAEALGTSVYHPGVPIEQRWERPDVVAEVAPDGSSLMGWYPGRVLAASAQAVEVVLATPGTDPIRVIRTTLTADEWKASQAHSRPQDASGYFYLARYQKGLSRIVPVGALPVPWERSKAQVDPMRYLRRLA